MPKPNQKTIRTITIIVAVADQKTLIQYACIFVTFWTALTKDIVPWIGASYGSMPISVILVRKGKPYVCRLVGSACYLTQFTVAAL